MDVPQGHPNSADPRAFLEGVRPQIQAKLEEEIEALNGVKFQLALKVQLRKDNPDGSEEYMSPVMRHKQEAALQNSEIDAALNQAFPAIQETLEKWTQRGSGWVVHQVETLWLDIARYQPLRGGSYIPLPAAVRNKKAVVNVKNKDDNCFWRCIVAAENPVDIHPERPGNYPQQAIEETAVGLILPCQSLRFQGPSGKTTGPSTSLGGIKERLLTTSANSPKTYQG